MDIDSKLKLFRSLVQNQSLTDIEKQAGVQGIEVIQRIAEACTRQDSKSLLQHLDRYLVLASVTPRAIDLGQAELRPEAFNDIRDVLAPILQEMSPSPAPGLAPEAVKQQPKRLLERLWLRLFKRHKPTA